MRSMRLGQTGVLARGARMAWHASRRGTVVAALLQVLTAISAIGIVVSTQFALQSIVSDGSGVTRSLIIGLVLLSVSTALSGSAGMLQQQHQRVLGERVSQFMWARLLRTTADADLLAWESPAFMDRLDRVRMNALQRPVVIVTSLFSAVGASLGAIGMVAALATINPLLVPVILAAGVPILLIGRIASRTEFAFAMDSNQNFRDRTYLKGLVTTRANAAELRAFGSYDWLIARHTSHDDAYLGSLRRQAALRQILGIGSTLAAAATLALTMILIVVLIDRGDITLPQAGAAALAARLLSSQVSGVFGSITALVESAPFLSDLETFLEPIDNAAEVGTARDMQDSLEVKNVSFTYPGQSRPAVVDATITVPAGSVVALVGENGSGKSTLAKIASGLYPADRGAVIWDGAPAHRADLRASTSVLFQDFVRYSMSAADNIIVAAPQRPAVAADIESAARRAGIHDAITHLKTGYETRLGIEFGEGADLSGGQWQRLALARAFYRASPLIVLDEPTAAMDPRAEHELFSDVSAVLGGRSALMISHRYSSVRLADYIYVMHEGRIVEHGTHDELVATGGRYAELYRLQAAMYLDSHDETV